jgi:hypothetical protein
MYFPRNWFNSSNRILESDWKLFHNFRKEAIMWYNRIVASLDEIPNFIDHYEQELALAKKEIYIKGNVEKNLADLPGITENRFNQLEEVEAVLNFLNLRLRKIRRKHFQIYLEGYNRVLTSRDAEKYVDGEEEVVEFEMLINEVALLRNRYLGIMKGLEAKSYMIGHITRLRCAGMEDVSV